MPSKRWNNSKKIFCQISQQGISLISSLEWIFEWSWDNFFLTDFLTFFFQKIPLLPYFKQSKSSLKARSNFYEGVLIRSASEEKPTWD